MKNTNRLYLFLVSLCAVLHGCKTGVSQLTSHGEGIQTSYRNPVFKPILADPSVLRDPISGAFYAYGTEDDWGDGSGNRVVPILKSVDLTDWEIVGTAFAEKPNWKKNGGIWAPDAIYRNGKYYLYYAYSVWDDPNPGVGVATSNAPEGPFVDHGKMFDSQSIEVQNSIDPFLFTEEKQEYLFWGSFDNGPKQGTYGILLDPSGVRIAEASEKFKVAAGDLEAVIIHKHGDYYYFIGSRGSCCDGKNSTYHMVVGRSTNLRGPYLDKQGRDLTERGNGSLLLKGNSKFVGVGHGTRIIQDDRNQDWILFHGIDIEQGKVSSGATRRMLFLESINWVDGWPEVANENPSTDWQDKPYFK